MPKPGILVTVAADPYQAYLSGWSALRIHDRIQQIPQIQFAVTLGRPGEVDVAGARVALHRITPELFGGYSYESRADGFVASPEKAIFDLAYLSAMTRSRVRGSLPETNLRGLSWKEVKGWMTRIRTPSLRQAVGEVVERIREEHANASD